MVCIFIIRFGFPINSEVTELNTAVRLELKFYRQTEFIPYKLAEGSHALYIYTDGFFWEGEGGEMPHDSRVFIMMTMRRCPRMHVINFHRKIMMK